LAEEIDAYHPDVTVKFNDCAWNNEQLLKEWIVDELKPYLHKNLDGKALVVLDAASFYLTDEVKDAFGEAGAWRAVIPAGLTSVCQPCDTYFNKAFKILLFEEYD
jgi:hypothetical protein